MSDLPDSLLTISGFSRLSRLTPKALRLYEACGLLLPVHVDAQSGYRYYSPQQLEHARTVALLRQLDMPLREIQALLELPPFSKRARLAHFWQLAEAQHAQRRALTEYVMAHILPQGAEMPTQTLPAYSIEERQMPAQLVLTRTRRLKVSELPSFLPATYQEFRNWAAAHALDAETATHAEWFVIYHGPVNEHEDGPVEVCFPLTGPSEAVLPEGASLRTEPARRELYTTLTLKQLEFPALLEAYDAVAAALRERGLTPALDCRESYFGDASQPDQPFCHIAFPVA
ncbi:MerR family transcriptional regulator [Deinococcus sp. KNUC1210]|uniref:MerR family transcriptional regulator n=1 Tax=Deinococcus sp. KNUC1210 TaxID=2917691 RepID=UPI001EF03DEE|nr:MerR family transcriptional regulator [Deinococcus sp. KNUC1210]ULH16046.1 MerR family transcriptional regulator [Deinococcus sp. KNUC1210]